MATINKKQVQYFYEFDHDLKLNEFLKYIGWKKSTFYDNLDKIFGEDGVYKIPKYLFKKVGRAKGKREDLIKDENEFIFKKEWAGLAIVLVKIYKANPMYKSNSSYKKLTLEKYMEYNKFCLEEIERLPIYQRQIIQQHPIYYSMIQECICLSHIQKTVYGFLRSMIDMPIEGRVHTLLELDKNIKNFLVHMWGQQLVDKDRIENQKPIYEGLYYEELNELQYGDYEHNYIDKFIEQYLMKEMDENHVKKRDILHDLYLENALLIDRGDLNEDEKSMNELINTTYLEIDIQNKMDQAKQIGNNMVSYERLAKEYLTRNRSVLTQEQCHAIIDFVQTVNLYEKEFNHSFHDEKEVVEKMFSATNANIIRRN